MSLGFLDFSFPPLILKGDFSTHESAVLLVGGQEDGGKALKTR